MLQLLNNIEIKLIDARITKFIISVFPGWTQNRSGIQKIFSPCRF